MAELLFCSDVIQSVIYDIFKNILNICIPVVLKENRPWGHFERFTLNEPCTVKLIYIDADKRLSLQYHNNRSEFWKIVRGPVKVQIGNDIRILQTGETITIPKKAVHRITGEGVDAIVLEIATGSFDENDIVRLEDDYKRH